MSIPQPNSVFDPASSPFTRFVSTALGILCITFSAFAADDYKLGPDSFPQEGVPVGRVEGPLLFKSQVFTNTLREHWMFVCP